MKLKSLLITSLSIGATLSSLLIQKPYSCERMLPRKEFRDMSPEEWKIFRDAFWSLQERPSPAGTEGHSEWDYWTKMHVDNMMSAHRHPVFLPWHRAYVLALEQRLQRINPNITIPMWDWTFDWRAPLQSPIFSPKYGLDVKPGPQGDCRYKRKLFNEHCLIRDYNATTFPTYYSPAAVSRVIQNITDYEEYRELIELVPHAIVHTSLGGEKGDMGMMNSPNDPIFFLHHSMVDYVWWKWQLVDAARFSAYKGDLDSIIEPFNVTVRDVLDIRNWCYYYEPLSQNPIMALDAENSKSLVKREEQSVENLKGRNQRQKMLRKKKNLNKVWVISKRWLSMQHLTLSKMKAVIRKFNSVAGIKN